MTEPIITELTAFDARGVYVGRAYIGLHGLWCVDMVQTKGLHIDCGSQQEAESFLREHGATTIKESDGRK